WCGMITRPPCGHNRAHFLMLAASIPNPLTTSQVFHVCQQGGRKNSFLCPNGTMFNQQMFVCDWWHNVQCDEVPQHYALNQQIYDHSWESKRITNKKGASASVATSQPDIGHRMSHRRQAVLEDSHRNDIDSSTPVSLDFNQRDELQVKPFQEGLLTTTIRPTLATNLNEDDDHEEEREEEEEEEDATTVPSAVTSLTESVFGTRSRKQATTQSSSE